jgi:hypothetical protein
MALWLRLLYASNCTPALSCGYRKFQNSSELGCEKFEMFVLRVMNFISAVQVSQPYKNDGIAQILYICNPDCLWTEYGLKTLFRSDLPEFVKFTYF